MSGLHVTPNGEGKVRNSKYSVVLCSVGVTQAMLKKGAKCLTATQICDTLRLCGCAPCGYVAVHRAVVWLCIVRLCGCAPCGENMNTSINERLARGARLWMISRQNINCEIFRAA